MKVYFLGGAAEVGASCVLVEYGTRRVLFDCGMRMKGDPLPDLALVQQAGGVDAVVVSHAHMDHTGSLPVISDAFPNASVFMTPPTRSITQVLLNDSLKIMGQEEELPSFNRRQVEQFLERIVTVPFEDPRPIFEDAGVQLRLFPAGHILGAAMALVTSKDGSFFYTGDVSAGGQKTIGGLSVPARLRPDVCVVESTYGARLHASRDRETDRLIEMVGQVLERGGKVLIPAFAVGRAQEVILLLRSALANGRLPAGKVYVDGMVREVCRIYKEYPNYLSATLAKRIWRGNDVFFNDSVCCVETKEQRRAIVESSDPCVIVASSGMLSGGASAFYAEQLAAGSENLIAITGYQDEESPGRALQNLFEDSAEEKIWPINGRQVSLKCRLGTYGLSAHADKSELSALVERLAPARTFVVHGDAAARAELGRTLNEHLRGRVYVPGNGASFLVEAGGKCAVSGRVLPPSLNRNAPPQEATELTVLSEYLKEKHPTECRTAGELANIWGDSELDETEWTALLNESDRFECDERRLYRYRPVDAAVSPFGGRMEVNAALAEVARAFPPESGLYKKGARLAEGILLLSFRFPKPTAERWKQEIRALEALTGWTVELNRNPDTSFLQPLIQQLLGDEADLFVKVAWFLERGRIEATLRKKPADPEALCRRFQEESGLDLILTFPGQTATAAAPDELPGGNAIASPRCTQQDAMAMVQAVFEPENVTIYKIKVLSDAAGKYLEIQFLTPELGARYQKWLRDLTEQSGWRMVPSPNPRQQELIAAARGLIDPHGIITKGPGIVAAERLVRVKAALSDSADTEVLKKRFEEKTAYVLEVLEE